MKNGANWQKYTRLQLTFQWAEIAKVTLWPDQVNVTCVDLVMWLSLIEVVTNEKLCNAISLKMWNHYFPFGKANTYADS